MITNINVKENRVTGQVNIEMSKLEALDLIKRLTESVHHNVKHNQADTTVGGTIMNVAYDKQEQAFAGTIVITVRDFR